MLSREAVRTHIRPTGLPWMAAAAAMAACLAAGCARSQGEAAGAGRATAAGTEVAQPVAVEAKATLAPAAGTVTLVSLLEEMIDRDRVARWPAPFYLCKQFSSYNRLAKTPDDPKGWFANGDNGYFLRTETNAGRTEWVLMDHAGPGCIARIWSPDRRLNNGKETATVRFYLDGADEPALEAPFLDLLTGRSLVKPPLAYVSRRAGVLYLPIPFAKGCKVTLDQKPFYYIITYRAYEKGTKVQTFSKSALDRAQATVERVGKTLLEAPGDAGDAAAAIEKRVAPGGRESVALPAGPAAVRTIRLTLDPRDAQALRSTVLVMEADGETTVWCPVGDFFGSGVGLNPFQGWYRTVAKDGTLSCRWVMPYRASATLAVLNLGKAPVTVSLKAATGPWMWDDRSMHFHAGWRQQYPLPTRPHSDWNYIDVKGQGVYVGDTLAVMNPVARWWGEGDEKIWVDDEPFPSHFGTGTEDYYGYAWGGRSNDVYAWPFHAQPRCGPATFGHNTETRTRALDTIPFTKHLKLDMEVWHWVDCNAAYAVATYWYGRPGATSNRGPEPKEAARPVPAPPAKPPAPPKPPRKKPAPARPVKVPGAIEFETLEPMAKSPGVQLRLQARPQYGWSAGRQWLVQTMQVGDFVEFALPVASAEPQSITLHATKARDYGRFRISVNGKPVDGTFDFYNPEVIKTGPVPLGTHRPEGGRFVLRFEVVGSNPAAVGDKTFLGLDAAVLGKP